MTKGETTPVLIIPITIIVAWLIAFVAVVNVDVLGLCQTAESFIDLDTGIPGYENALVQWKEFAGYYHCKEVHK